MSNPNRKRRQTLSEALAELERTDPAVKQAAENYDRVVSDLLRRKGHSLTPDDEQEGDR